jgi:hypothetical protein
LEAEELEATLQWLVDSGLPTVSALRASFTDLSSTVASAGPNVTAAVAPQVVVYGGPDLRPVICVTCDRREPSQCCGCSNGRKKIQCYKCLNDNYTWCCGCESDD